MTDFALRPDLTGRVPGARGLLSRLSRRARPADSSVPSAILAVPPATVPPTTSGSDAAADADAPTARGDVRTVEDLACSWPSFVHGAAVGDLRWLDTPSGPCLVGSFVPPVPRSLR